ncbi:acyl-CoA dehydratase activase [Nocardia jiangxiensis]|uniref:acyl-CoA dehydratase activase n=1 Tax=Nocardia jiangxiensis TaxID=282685 RepID=UPI0002E20BDE|nr:acyl-CoA dehydratase activase [Nocardia jiangxiensis]
MSSYFLGVDLGSTTAKAAIVDENAALVASSVVQMGAVSRQGMRRAIDAALRHAGLRPEEITRIVGTGYGRRLVPDVDRTFTEITCHARGVVEWQPDVGLIVDIGGQDSKAITIDDLGLVDEFAMNDRCASGTGRFFEVLARALECEVDEIGGLALRGTADLEVSSMCATFAETEIVSLVAEGADPADIAASVHRAVTARILGLVALVGKRTPVVLTGGVAKNPAAIEFLAQALDTPVIVPRDPQVTGAFGAALLARDATAPSTRGEPLPLISATSSGADCSVCTGPN